MYPIEHYFAYKITDCLSQLMNKIFIQNIFLINLIIQVPLITQDKVYGINRFRRDNSCFI